MGHAVTAESKRKVWMLCILLGVVTIVEIGMALLHYYEYTVYPKWILNAMFIILSAVKAWYIMSEFMHLKYEVSSMKMSILLPFIFLIWFIIAFLWEGSSWGALNEAYQNLLG